MCVCVLCCTCVMKCKILPKLIPTTLSVLHSLAGLLWVTENAAEKQFICNERQCADMRVPACQRINPISFLACVFFFFCCLAVHIFMIACRPTCARCAIYYDACLQQSQQQQAARNFFSNTLVKILWYICDCL